VQRYKFVEEYIMANFPVARPAQDSALIQEISSNDTMYVQDVDHYFRVGASALRCIQAAMFTANRSNFDKILDFPCGHGRVTRHLKAAFPQAQITVADLERDAVDFCAKTFAAVPVYSSNDTRQIDIQGGFDLIWCGSLLTHFDAAQCLEFLTFFRKLLAPRGILVFTMHGRLSANWLRTGTCLYSLEAAKIPGLVKSYDATGFGYLDYPNAKGYGISLAAPAWTISHLQTMSDMNLLAYTEMGWDSHQDVIACMRNTDKAI
jgi:SAM-dependent methyltransferase